MTVVKNSHKERISTFLPLFKFFNLREKMLYNANILGRQKSGVTFMFDFSCQKIS